MFVQHVESFLGVYPDSTRRVKPPAVGILAPSGFFFDIFSVLHSVSMLSNFYIELFAENFPRLECVGFVLCLFNHPNRILHLSVFYKVEEVIVGNSAVTTLKFYARTICFFASCNCTY